MALCLFGASFLLESREAVLPSPAAHAARGCDHGARGPARQGGLSPHVSPDIPARPARLHQGSSKTCSAPSCPSQIGKVKQFSAQENWIGGLHNAYNGAALLCGGRERGGGREAGEGVSSLPGVPDGGGGRLGLASPALGPVSERS